MIIHSGSFGISFLNRHVIYENIIKITVKEKDFNISYNRSLLQDSSNLSGSVKPFVTGSDFVPYATTIGIYNDNQDLLMVAKLSQPIPMSNYTDMNFLIKFDN